VYYSHASDFRIPSRHIKANKLYIQKSSRHEVLPIIGGLNDIS
jgi:hypothetical protein